MLSIARNAVDRDRILPFYQPKFDLVTDGIVGFEALLRWTHEGRGVQLPGSIAAAFDDPELAVVMGERMQILVIADMRGWLDRKIAFGRVAINASAAEFRDVNFATQLLERLAHAGVPPTCLELEITESVFLSHNTEHVGSIIHQLSAAEITIALDDFGTGYASLAHLKQFPVNVLKIDPSFVARLSENCDDAVVHAIIGIGQHLAITTVAEGIETLSQRDRLLAWGCDVGQGFLFSPAIPARDVAALLQARPRISARRDQR